MSSTMILPVLYFPPLFSTLSLRALDFLFSGLVPHLNALKSFTLVFDTKIAEKYVWKCSFLWTKITWRTLLRTCLQTPLLDTSFSNSSCFAPFRKLIGHPELFNWRSSGFTNTGQLDVDESLYITTFASRDGFNETTSFPLATKKYSKKFPPSSRVKSDDNSC